MLHQSNNRVSKVYQCTCVCVLTYQLTGLINGENVTIEAVLEVYVGISKQCNQLLALILHACEGDGDLIIIQLLRQNGQKTRQHGG